MPPPLPDSYEDDNIGLDQSNVFDNGASNFDSQHDEENDSPDERNSILPRHCDPSQASPESFVSDSETISGQQQILNSKEDTDSQSQSSDCVQKATGIGHPGARLGSNGHKMSHISKSGWIYPKSRYEGYIPPLPISRERNVILEFLEDVEYQNSRAQGSICDEFTEFELSDFTVYLPGNIAHHKWEMRGLQNLSTRASNSWYCFDGILSCGKFRRYVQCVPFDICSIGQYGHEFNSVGDQIWIQSRLNHKSEIYYKLKAPAPEYYRYHEGFKWLANLAKHFVDFANCFASQKINLSIHNFKVDFACWLDKTHGKSPAYREWYLKHGHRDFRRAIATNIDFLWKEYIGTDPELFEHSLWSQVKDMNFIPEQPLKETQTVVTPYVYDCFYHLKFGSHLKKVELNGEVATRRKSQGQSLRLTVSVDIQGNPEESLESRDLAVSKLQRAATDKMRKQKLDRKSIAVGDVLGVIKDAKTSWRDEVSKWKAADESWWVLVQGVHEDKNGNREFDVIWLYKPSDTSCAMMRYPFHDELFLSDNCNCGDARITEDEVLCKASVTWNGLPGKHGSDFFIRQTFLHDNSFVTLQKSHKQCFHLRNGVKSLLQEAIDRYQIGDTVLIVPPRSMKSKHSLEPVEISHFIRQGDSGMVCVRLLMRRLDLDISECFRPNELVYTDEFLSVKVEKVVRKCLVRFYSEKDLVSRAIPAPYSRDGTGNAFYITKRLLSGSHVGRSSLEPIGHDPLQSLIEGFDPKASAPRQRLRGLDLYCGGGNFGRGLEEGGAVQMTHAIDLAGNAIHTYYANTNENSSTKCFWGSVDDVLNEVLHDNPSESDLIPLPGMIDFLSAGSPCQGYSLLNAHRGNETGLKNQSLVASVAAYVDVYRPKYALLENVIAMAQKGKFRDEDVLSQLICCLVGIGYQVQMFLLDAWSCGSPQSRSRLFVAMAAPGLKLPEHPHLSHSHPAGTSTRGLGQGANGLSFGQRKFEPTPFGFVTASEATQDLPDIGDAREDHCTQQPDHRVSIGVSQRLKRRIELIPRYPREMSLFSTLQSKLLSSTELQMFSLVRKDGKLKECAGAGSRAWGRLHPQKFFPTVATCVSPGDARTGRAVHWDQHRLMTVLEARRAQGFPDDEVLTGIPSKQWKIVGNSVARTVALALGLSLRDAWLSSPLSENNDANELTLQLQDTFKSTQTSPLKRIFRAQIFDRPVLTMADNSEGSADEAMLSDRQYDHVLGNLGLRSSVSSDERASSGTTTPLSERKEVKGVKRHRKEDFAPAKNQINSKRVKPGPMSKPVSESSSQAEPAAVFQISPGSTRNEVNLKRRADFQSKQLPSLQKALTLLREEQRLLTEKKAKKRISISEQAKQNKSVSKPSYTRQNNAHHRLDIEQPLSLQPQQNERVSISASRSYQSHVPRIVTTNQGDLGQSTKASAADHQNNHCSSTTKKTAFLVNLVSDDEEDSQNVDEDNKAADISGKPVTPYIPADNAFIAAYEKSHQVMKLGWHRKSGRGEEPWKTSKTLG